MAWSERSARSLRRLLDRFGTTATVVRYSRGSAGLGEPRPTSVAETIPDVKVGMQSLSAREIDQLGISPKMKRLIVDAELLGANRLDEGTWDITLAGASSPLQTAGEFEMVTVDGVTAILWLALFTP